MTKDNAFFLTEVLTCFLFFFMIACDICAGIKKMLFSFNVEAKSFADIIERERSCTKSLSSDWCKSCGTVEVEEHVLISEMSKKSGWVSSSALDATEEFRSPQSLNFTDTGTGISVECGTGNMTESPSWDIGFYVWFYW